MHTPTPLRNEGLELLGPKGENVGRLFAYPSRGVPHSLALNRAEEIVRAVNAHEALVEALTSCLSLVRGHAISKQVLEALALAELP